MRRFVDAQAADESGMFSYVPIWELWRVARTNMAAPLTCGRAANQASRYLLCLCVGPYSQGHGNKNPICGTVPLKRLSIRKGHIFAIWAKSSSLYLQVEINLKRYPTPYPEDLKNMVKSVQNLVGKTTHPLNTEKCSSGTNMELHSQDKYEPKWPIAPKEVMLLCLILSQCLPGLIDQCLCNLATKCFF